MQKLLSFSLIATACVVTFFTLFGSHGLTQFRALLDEEEMLRANNRRLRSDIVESKNRLYAVQKDEHSLEKSVRTELGMAKPGEIIYVFPQTQPE